jgi:hypothetical protein
MQKTPFYIENRSTGQKETIISSIKGRDKVRSRMLQVKLMGFHGIEANIIFIPYNNNSNLQNQAK